MGRKRSCARTGSWRAVMPPMSTTSRMIWRGFCSHSRSADPRSNAGATVPQKPTDLAAIEWEDLRYFLYLAREKSLSGAARKLGTTQPTMSRRLELFESKLGAILFDRLPSGLRLSDTGRQILDYAERMEDAALAAQRIAAAEALSLTRREIDVALRFGRFQQDGLMQRKIGSIPFELYAAAAYLKAKGPPDFSDGGADAALITMNAALAESVAETKWLRRYLPQAHVGFCSNSRDGLAAAAAAGLALIFFPTRLASAYPALRLINTPAP